MLYKRVRVKVVHARQWSGSGFYRLQVEVGANQHKSQSQVAMGLGRVEQVESGTAARHDGLAQSTQADSIAPVRAEVGGQFQLLPR